MVVGARPPPQAFQPLIWQTALRHAPKFVASAKDIIRPFAIKAALNKE